MQPLMDLDNCHQGVHETFNDSESAEELVKPRKSPILHPIL